MTGTDFEAIFSLCRKHLSSAQWLEVVLPLDQTSPEAFIDALSAAEFATMPWVVDLATLELARYRVACAPFPPSPENGAFAINPTLEIHYFKWQGCVHFLNSGGKAEFPKEGEEWALVWKTDRDEALHVETADDAQLLALKALSEDLSIDELAEKCDKTPSAVRQWLLAVSRSGMICSSPSRIARIEEQVQGASTLPNRDREVQIFTLQWHLTNRCDLHCRHCYDRTDRTELSTSAALDVLDDFARFCERKKVSGHVSFSGGNPLMRPDFLDIYSRAARLGFELSILGNPTSREMIERIQAIHPMDFFQTSLEGLSEHNDTIRGPGHFRRVMIFLPILSDLGVSSSIMLTLTRDNIDQVIPLAEHLEGRADHFTFNRLSPVGEGAALALPEQKPFREFLARYVDAAEGLTVAGYKDNLINLELVRRGLRPFYGCTGFGCGAAFNFLALLPDGKVHACRKYPSPVGDICISSLLGIYDSSAAARYRRRPDACRDCLLTAVCGGCKAITTGLGLDQDADADPFCPDPIETPVCIKP